MLRVITTELFGTEACLFFQNNSDVKFKTTYCFKSLKLLCVKERGQLFLQWDNKSLPLMCNLVEEIIANFSGVVFGER